jgi:hypothetical protein
MQIFYDRFDTGGETVTWDFNGAILGIYWKNIPEKQVRLPPRKAEYYFYLKPYDQGGDSNVTDVFWDHIKKSDQEWMMRKMILTIFTF